MSDALKSAGLSVHEFALFELCARQAGMAAGPQQCNKRAGNNTKGWGHRAKGRRAVSPEPSAFSPIHHYTSFVFENGISRMRFPVAE